MNKEAPVRQTARGIRVAAIVSLGVGLAVYAYYTEHMKVVAVREQLAKVESQISETESFQARASERETFNTRRLLALGTVQEELSLPGSEAGTNLVAYFNGLDTYAVSGMITQPAPAITIDLRFWYIPKEDACVFVGALDDTLHGGWAVFYDPEPADTSQYGVPGINAGWSSFHAGNWTDDQAVLTNAPPYNDPLHPHVLTISADVSRSNELVFLDGKFIFTLPGSAFTNEPDREPMPLSRVWSAVTIGAVRQDGEVVTYSPGYVSDLRISGIQRHATTNDYVEPYPWVDDESVLHHWSAAASNPNSNILVDVTASNHAVFFGPGPYFARPPQTGDERRTPWPKRPQPAFRDAVLLRRFQHAWHSTAQEAAERLNEIDERRRDYYYEELRQRSVIQWLAANSNRVFDARIHLYRIPDPIWSAAPALANREDPWKVTGFYGSTVVLTSSNQAPHNIVLPADQIRGLW